MRVRKINIVLKMTIHVTKMFRIGADAVLQTASAPREKGLNDGILNLEGRSLF